MPTHWYQANRKNAEKQIGQVAERKRKLRQWMSDQKVQCSICGYSRCKTALEFHHRGGGKEIQPSEMINRGWGVERMVVELAKCDVVCANCHREIHASIA